MADEIITGTDIGALTSYALVANSTYQNRCLTTLAIAQTNNKTKTTTDTAIPLTAALFTNDTSQVKECVRKSTVSYVTGLLQVDFTTLSGYYPTGWLQTLSNSSTNAAKLLCGSISIVKQNGYFYPNYHVGSGSNTYSLFGTSGTWDMSSLYCTSITAYTSTNITVHNDIITSFRANANSTFSISGCTSLRSLYLGAGAKASSTTIFSGCTNLKSIIITANPTGTGGIISNAAVNYSLLPSGGHVSINWNDPNGSGTFYFDSNCYYRYTSVSVPAGGGFMVGGYGLFYSPTAGGWSALFRDRNWTLSNSGTEFAGGGGYGYY